MEVSLCKHDALLVVDMQNDFLPGGSLAVAGSDVLLPIINAYIQHFINASCHVFASRDYHPANHISFNDQGGPWPPHCVAGSSGAEFHKDLRLPENIEIISKATTQSKEVYSALEETPLLNLLQKRDIKRVFICGLATDYCVLASACDLLKERFDVVILIDGIKGVDVKPGDGERALEKMKDLGASETTLEELAT